jgi:hypothetical protein
MKISFFVFNNCFGILNFGFRNVSNSDMIMSVDGDSEKFPKMTEKVPELSEKVPELSEKVIKMTEKVPGQSLQCPDCELSFKDARKLDNHHKMVHLVTWLIFR